MGRESWVPLAKTPAVYPTLGPGVARITTACTIAADDLANFPVCAFDRLERVVVLGVQVADGPTLAAEDHRFGLGPEVVIDDAVQELSIGDARGGEGNVLTAHQVVDREDAAQVLVAGGARFLLVVAGPQPEAALQVAAQAFQRAGGEHRLR